jgi:hypothetical protein
MKKCVRTKKLYIPKVPRVNPIEKANELAKQLGPKDAIKLATELHLGAVNALTGADGRSVMHDYISTAEVRKSAGLWGTVAGYLTRRYGFEKSAVPGPSK